MAQGYGLGAIYAELDSYIVLVRSLPTTGIQMMVSTSSITWHLGCYISRVGLDYTIVLFFRTGICQF